MLQSFPKATILALLAALAPLLMLAVACATAATPIPTATPTPTATVAPTPDIGNWVREDFTDAIDDRGFLTVKLQASESTLTFPYDDPWLSVGCVNPSSDNSQIAILILWDEYLGSGNPQVDWRVDSKPARTDIWKGANEAIAKDKAYREVNDLLRAEKITVRVHRDFAENLTAVWHPAGFAAAYPPVAAACGK